MDELIGAVDVPGVEFPLAGPLSVLLGLAHFAVLSAVIWRLGQEGAVSDSIALGLAAGLFFGQIGTANAHELIHRSRRGLRWLGTGVFVSLLFGHHASAHPLVHHVHVATPRDPNTPRRGEGYYRFVLRAWVGSFRAGYLAERQRQARAGIARMSPYWVYILGGAACLGAAWALGDTRGAVAYLALCGFAQAQLLISDYVQHYGLERRETDGRYEPVGPRHSWNAPHVFTSHMMLNAPRHSAHHTRPDLRFDALAMPSACDEAPVLPYSLPAMSCLALIPPLWRRAMDPRVAYWRRVSLGNTQVAA
jgi:alkane 1-monooxygenase